MTEPFSQTPDSNKGDKKTPLPVQAAQEALVILATENATTAESLNKILPAFAMKLFKAGEEVTVETLLTHARQGIEHLTAARTVMPEQKPLTYVEVASAFKPQAPVKKYDDSPYGQMIEAGKAGDLKKVKTLLDLWAKTYIEYNVPLGELSDSDRPEVMGLLLDYGVYDGAGPHRMLVAAAGRGHTETVRLLLDRGVDIHDPNELALRDASVAGHTETVRLLLDRGANINGFESHPLREAVQFEKIETARLLLERGAHLRAHPAHLSYLLVDACRGGHIEMVQLLLDYKIDPRANNDEALRSASPEIIHLLINSGVPLKILNKEQKNTYQSFIAAKTQWERVARCEVPHGLWAMNPSYFRPQAFPVVKEMLAKEKYNGPEANQMAFAALALFQTEQRVLQYLEKWGAAGKQPLHDIIHLIKAPKEVGADTKAWGDAALKFGPGMAKLFAFADRLPQPEKSADGKTWSLQNTREKAAQFAYARGGEHAELAALCFENARPEEDFNAALKLVKTQKKFLVKNLPEIVIDGKIFDMEGAVFRRLAANDVRGLVLGELTDCCQSIGGVGEECAEHGFMSENGGFYVVEKEDGEIIGQTWAWRGQKGELVFDSLETLGQRVAPEQWEMLIEAFAEAVAQKPGNVTALHIGRGGGTQNSLKKAFNGAAAVPVDYAGYRDSKGMQSQVWKGKTYKP